MQIEPDFGALSRASDDIPSKAVVTNNVRHLRDRSSSRSEQALNVAQAVAAVGVDLNAGAAEDCNEKISMWVCTEAVWVPVFMLEKYPPVGQRAYFDIVVIRPYGPTTNVCMIHNGTIGAPGFAIGIRVATLDFLQTLIPQHVKCSSVARLVGGIDGPDPQSPGRIRLAVIQAMVAGELE
nr:hypothetical protein [Neorhizobium vignae]